MSIYKIRLRSLSPFLTPLQADTVFGHLCWVVAHREGEEGIKEFLTPFIKGNPPFVVSDGFPEGFLPKPVSLDYMGSKSPDLKPEERKKIKRVEFITLAEFNRIRKGEVITPSEEGGKEQLYSTIHNTISRLTFTTLKEGGLYTLEERFAESYEIYVKIIRDDWKRRVIELFEALSKTGFGKKKSIGKGHFSIESVEPFNDFCDVEGADGFVTLSSFFPRREDPTDGFYRTFVKYGKLGEEFTYCGNPFKRPVMLIKTGSVFKTDGRVEEYYGCMIKGIASAKQDVVQYGYAFSVPLKLCGE